MAFTLPPLPYDFGALEPHIDAKTMEIHHGKHHATYVNNLNAAIEKAPDARTPPWPGVADFIPTIGACGIGLLP